MQPAKENEPVLLVDSDGKKFLVVLKSGARFHSHKGMIEHDAIIGEPLGRYVTSHLGHPFAVLRPSLYDRLMNIKRASQIIYPKDIGQILLRLDIGPGRRIIEAGTGSGALTLALAHAIRPGGVVYSYDSRDDMLRLAEKNLRNAGLQDYVCLILGDIADGFEQTDVDSLFMDVREPWLYLEQATAALGDGGFFGALVPTTNQVSDLLGGISVYPFSSIEVLETLERKYKPVPERLRPEDVMVGHTGYLLFARKIAQSKVEVRLTPAEDQIAAG